MENRNSFGLCFSWVPDEVPQLVLPHIRTLVPRLSAIPLFRLVTLIATFVNEVQGDDV